MHHDAVIIELIFDTDGWGIVELLVLYPLPSLLLSRPIDLPYLVACGLSFADWYSKLWKTCLAVKHRDYEKANHCHSKQHEP